LPKFVHSACPGTHLYNLYHGQSEVALKRRTCTRLILIPTLQVQQQAVENHLLSVPGVPVPNFTKCVHSKCTGTQFYQLCLGQSEIALKVGRAQD